MKNNFESNLELYLKLNSEDGPLLRKLQPVSSQYDLLSDADFWFENEKIGFKRVIFLYGLGNGDYYQRAKKWLGSSKEHFLVVLEPDKQRIRSFLEGPIAHEFLTDPRAFLLSFERDLKVQWKSLLRKISPFSKAFATSAIHYTLHKSYHVQREGFFQELISYIFTYTEEVKFSYGEYQVDYQKLVFENLYEDLFHLPYVRFGESFCNQFEKVPAIICGAGPSIVKDLPLLSQIGQNRALIFAAGTGLNILGHFGIRPHFGAGLDPTLTQHSRILTNGLFDIPFFYFNRFNHKALLQLHHEKLFLKGGVFQQVTDWFEESLNITGPKALKVEVSTSNFCLNLARFFGCDPIIFIGMDLAYTDTRRYPIGVVAHPVDSHREHKLAEQRDSSAFLFTAEDGREVLTKADWVFERESYSAFAFSHSDCSFINSTRVGLEIVGFQSLPFDEVVKDLLKNEYDLSLRVHNAVQNTQWPKPIVLEDVEKVLMSWKKSMNRVEVAILEFLGKLEKECILRDVNDEEIWKTSLFDHEKLICEPFYSYFLEEVVCYCLSRSLKDTISHQFHPKNFSREGHFSLHKKMEMEICHHLLKVINTHKELFEKIESSKISISDYYESGQFEAVEIFDTSFPFPELGKEVKEYYPSGAIKSQCFYKDSRLHGPSSIFSEQGKLRGKGFFLQGKEVGKRVTYYDTGQLYSTMSFEEGKLFGKVEFYYRNGQYRSILSFNRGVLHGDVCLYYPSGKKKRELHFINGALRGLERAWYPSGQMMHSVEYLDNRPIGQAKNWHSNGVLAKKLTYYKGVDNYDEWIFDDRGNLVEKHVYLSNDIFKDFKQKLKNMDKFFK